MAGRGMHSWTLSGLIGAFVDLAIAYLLLCASTLAFFASKFLGFFGLCLPCPCNGLIGNPRSNCGLHRLLVDSPIESVYSVQLSVKNKFPFDSHSAEGGGGRNFQLNLKVLKASENYVDGAVEMEGEASCSSISGTGKWDNVAERDLVLRNEPGSTMLGVVDSSLQAKEGRFDLKGKGVIDQRSRSGLRHHRKCVTDYGKVSSISNDDSSSADAVQSTISYNRRGCEVFECNSVPADSGVEADRFHYDDGDWIMRNVRERSLRGSELTEACDENEPAEKHPMSFEEIKRSDAQEGLGVDSNEKNAIRILEQELEEEHAARAVLYLELEKERSAAASAADEAMAMILRLQEEKAYIEMEARQYQRIIEEKASYDAEEMNILKEIIVRREREKHFLEKEVEAYRQMIYDGNQQLQDDDQSTLNTQEEQLASSLKLGEDAILMLQQLCESIDKDMVKDGSSVNKTLSIDKQNCALVVGEKLQTPGWGESEFSKQEDLDNQFSRKSGSQEHDFSQKTIPLSGEQKEQNANAQQCKEMTTKTVESHNVAGIHIPHNDENLEHHGKDECQERKYPGNVISDMVPRVHDVHFIDGESNFCTVVTGNKNERQLENDLSNVCRINDLPLKDSEIQRLDTDPGINRNNSEIAAGLPPLGGSKGAKSLLSDQRRNPKSEVDNERLKIDSEIGWLRERLRIIQEGREKLNFFVEHREGEKIQLQLLEDIACQLREIRQLTEPGKAMRQASLPLPSSKMWDSKLPPQVMSKKRRHRSASLGVQKSS